MKCLSVLGLSFSLLTAPLFAEDMGKLYQFHGKTHSNKDLPPALQNAVYEIQRQAYENLKQVVDAALLEQYASTEAKKKGITVEKFEEQNFKAKKVDDKDTKKWFEENKARLGGRDFESIKNDIKQLIQNQEDNKVRTTVLTKIKDQGKFKFMGEEPTPPTLEISTTGFPTKGANNARVRIVEFADYKCPHCRDASKALKSVVEKYKEKVQFVYLDFPIDRSGVSKKVAEGGVCADKQEKFWDYHYLAFGDGPLGLNSPMEFAKQLKLNLKDFEACLNAPETAKKVDLGRSEGERIGVNGTPTIYFNGKIVYGHSEKMLEDELKKLL